MLALAALWKGLSTLASLLMGIVIGAAITAAILVIFYEGLRIPIPFLPDIVIVTGRLQAARAVERQACVARIEKSVREASRRDAAGIRASIEQALRDQRAAEARAALAERENRDYEQELASLEPAVRTCRSATERDLRRLQ